MGASAKVQIDIQAKSNLASVLSASTKAARGTEEALKRLNGIKLPNFGKSIADSLRSASAPSRQIASNYGKAEKHAKGLYDASKAIGRLKRPVWQIAPQKADPTSPSGSSAAPSSKGMSKAELERSENVEVWRAIYRQQKQRQDAESKHKKAMEKEDQRRIKLEAKREKEQGERWQKFSSSWYRLQSSLDRMAFFGSLALNQVAFPLFGGIKNYAKESFDAIGSMRRMSMQLDMTTNEISNFQRIVQEQGGTQEDANDALATFRENIVKAVRGDPGALRYFQMTGTSFADSKGQARAVGAVLRDYMKNYERLLKSGGGNFRRYGAQEYMEGPFGRGGAYLYTGIRSEGDYERNMSRKAFGATESQKNAWQDITGQVAKEKMELQRKAFEFVEQNKEFIKGALHDSAQIAKLVMWAANTPWVLWAMKIVAVGTGAAFIGGGIVALVTNVVLMVKSLVTALSGASFVGVVKSLASMGPKALQSSATRGFVESAAGTAAGAATERVGGSIWKRMFGSGAEGAAAAAGWRTIQGWKAAKEATILGKAKNVITKGISKTGSLINKAPKGFKWIWVDAIGAFMLFATPQTAGENDNERIIESQRMAYRKNPSQEYNPDLYNPKAIEEFLKNERKKHIRSHKGTGSYDSSDKLQIDINIKKDGTIDSNVNSSGDKKLDLNTTVFNQLPLNIGMAPTYA